MAITSAIHGNYYGQNAVADSNRCNTPAYHHAAGKVPGLHCRSSNKWRYTSGVALESRCYDHYQIDLCVLPGMMDNAKVRLSGCGLHKILAHQQ
jgi:hypothetical protein